MQRILGVETEHALSAADASGQSIGRERLASVLFEIAREKLPHLQDEVSSGMYLTTGGRFYCDAGAHPEFTTPECDNPWDVVRYIRGGERILEELVTEASERIGAPVDLLRSQVCYAGTGSSWGCHESYSFRGSRERIHESLLPHLVSRIVYSGAGGFDSLNEGIAFVLSPRVPHIRHVTSYNSTEARGILHTKDEPLSTGEVRRLHLICGESLSSDLAAVLKVGTTALIVAMAEAGACKVADLWPCLPVTAMRTIAADPEMRAEVRIVDGRKLRALDIQRHYLRLAESQLGAPYMQEWASGLCVLWRRVLDALEDGPDAVDTQLDWAIKRKVFRRHSERQGVPWGRISKWNHVATRMGRALRMNHPAERLTQEIVGAGLPVLRTLAEGMARFRRNEAGAWMEFESYVRLRDELRVLDLRFGKIGGGSIFATLESMGLLDHRVDGVDDIEEAMSEPPPQPRAALRGRLVRENAGRPGVCADWQRVCDFNERRVVDLRNPFRGDGEWQSVPDMIEHPPEALRAALRGSAEGPPRLANVARLARLLMPS